MIAPLNAAFSPLARESPIAGVASPPVILSALIVREGHFVPRNGAPTARAIADNEALWCRRIAMHLLHLIAVATLAAA